MKAKIRETGEPVTITNLYDDGTAEIGEGVYIKVSKLDIDLDIKNSNFNEKRYILIKDFACAMMANPEFLKVYSSYFSERSEFDNINSYQEAAINCATYYADELIEQLKEENK